MKRTIVMMAAVLAIACVPAMAAETTSLNVADGMISADHGSITIVDVKEGQKHRAITIDTTPSGYVEVRTENDIVYRIYPCGKLEKKVWRELNPNEDKLTGIYSYDTLNTQAVYTGPIATTTLR